MREDKEINFLLQGNQRLWDQKVWFEQTLDFIIKDLEDLFSTQTILNAPSDDMRLIVKIRNKLFSINSRDNEALNDIKVGIIFYKTKEFKLAEEYLLHSADKKPVDLKDCDLCPGIINYLLAKIYIEKTEYRKANEYFLKCFQVMHSFLSTFEKIEYFIQWSYLFIDAGFYDLTEEILNLLLTKISPQISPIYTHLIHCLFLFYKRKNQTDIAISYANLLLSCPVEYLDNDEWYSVHLFSGEYNAGIKKNFDKSIYHFTKANSFLSLKWKEYLKEISLLKDFLKLSEYLKIRITYEDKMQEIILENNLHSSHYLTSLKNAYIELEQIYHKVHEYALTDSLTGLHNRRYLWEKVGEFINLAHRQKVPISCLMIDFDDFKLVNDKYGHLEGDRVIKKVSQAIKNHFRKTDIVIRFGGEEILVLLFNVSAENAGKIAEVLRSSIEDIMIVADNGDRIIITLSIGISSMDKVNPSKPNLIDILIEEADKKMYLAKENGKNKVIK